MDGILLVNKGKNVTSRDVVNDICHIFNTKKVGHNGTLDPMATGVLVIAINKGLKIVQDIVSLDKEYIAKITLGLETDTLDITGNILKQDNNISISEDDIDNVLNSFIGEYDMEVPKYSAVKINGKKLYEYARNNIEVELPVHKVRIYELKRISNITINNGEYEFSIKCKVSKGTYIRSLVRDICNKLNVLGVMSDLIRTKQGIFSIDDCYSIEDIKDGNYRIIPIKDALNIKQIELPDDIYKKVINGNKIDNIYNDDEILFIKDNKEVAIYITDINDKSKMRPKKVF